MAAAPGAVAAPKALRQFMLPLRHPRQCNGGATCSFGPPSTSYWALPGLPEGESGLVSECLESLRSAVTRFGLGRTQDRKRCSEILLRCLCVAEVPVCC